MVSLDRHPQPLLFSPAGRVCGRCEKRADILQEDRLTCSWYCGEHERLRLSTLLGEFIVASGLLQVLVHDVVPWVENQQVPRGWEPVSQGD